jgi:hypothetical protein
VCEVRAEKEETSEHQAQLPQLLGVFSVRFPLNLKIPVITTGEEKNLSDSMVDKNKNGETDLSVEFLSLHCPSAMPPHLMKLKVGTFVIRTYSRSQRRIKPLNAELNPICHLVALVGAHHILHISRVRVNGWDKTGGNQSCDNHMPSISTGGTCHALGKRSLV